MAYSYSFRSNQFCAIRSFHPSLPSSTVGGALSESASNMFPTHSPATIDASPVPSHQPKYVPNRRAEPGRSSAMPTTNFLRRSSLARSRCCRDSFPPYRPER